MPFLTTIVFLLLTFSGICQTPSHDTTTSRVLNSKLRLLIRGNESAKICSAVQLASDSIIRTQAAFLQVKDSLLTEMYNQANLYERRDHTFQVALGVVDAQAKVAQQQLGITQKLLRRQTWKTREVGGIGIAVTLFFGYLLIKK